MKTGMAFYNNYNETILSISAQNMIQNMSIEKNLFIFTGIESNTITKISNLKNYSKNCSG